MMKGIYNKYWGVEDVAILKFLYPETTNAAIGAILGKNEAAIVQKAFKLRLVKDKDFIRHCAQKTTFKKGHKSHNKGKSQADYMTDDKIERTKATRFSKGHLPHNAKANDGEISTRVDTKTGIPYQYIRTALGQWELLQRHNYRKFIGDIPKRHIVILKDGNHSNCHPFNLELITMRDNMLRNTIQRFPKELITTIKMLSKLKKTIKNHGKEQIN